MTKYYTLLSCPFCGGKAEIKDCGSGAYKIECENNCVAGNNHFMSKDIELLVRYWNMRKPVEKLVQQFKEELALADEEKRRCVNEKCMQFDNAKGYATGVYNALEMFKEAGVFCE